MRLEVVLAPVLFIGKKVDEGALSISGRIPTVWILRRLDRATLAAWWKKSPRWIRALGSTLLKKYSLGRFFGHDQKFEHQRPWKRFWSSALLASIDIPPHDARTPTKHTQQILWCPLPYTAGSSDYFAPVWSRVESFLQLGSNISRNKLISSRIHRVGKPEKQQNRAKMASGRAENQFWSISPPLKWTYMQLYLS